MSATDTGREAEAVAADYLRRQGFKIVERNFRRPDCEIDIVARKGKCIYFVEVKYRARAGQGTGLEYVTGKKQRQMAHAAAVWVGEHGWEGDVTLSAIEVSGPDFAIGEFVESIG